MTRLLPKETKVRFTIWKGITLLDLGLGIVGIGIVAGLAASGIPGMAKWVVVLIFACLYGCLFVPFDDGRLYLFVWRLIRYWCSKRRLKGAAVGEIVPYREIKGGLIRSKDHWRTAVIEIQPIGLDMLSEDAQNGLIDGTLSSVLNTAEGTEQWAITKIERPLVLDGHIQAEVRRDEVNRRQMREGRMTDAEYEARMALLDSRVKAETELNSAEDRYARFYLSLISKSAKGCLAKAKAAVGALQSGGIPCRLLNDKELLDFVRYSNREEFDEREAVDAEKAKGLLMPKSVSVNLTNAVVDGKQLSFLAINRYPGVVDNGWGVRLFGIPHANVIMRMAPVPTVDAYRRIDNSIMELQEKQGQGKASNQLESEDHLRSLTELLQSIQRENEKLFDTTLMLTVADKPGRSDNLRKAKSILREMGLGFSQLTARQGQAYEASFVGGKSEVSLKRGIPTSTCAACFPFDGDVLDDPDGFLIGETSLPAFVDWFKRDSAHVNSNMIVIGQSGSGKSYSTKTVLSGLASAGVRVYVLDPENEYGDLARNLGGTDLDVSAGKAGKLNPFQITSGLAGEEGESNGLYLHLQFLEEFFRVVLPGIDPDALEYLNRLVKEVYAEKAIFPTTDIRKLKATDFPTFQDLIGLVNRKAAQPGVDAYTLSNLRAISNYLAKFGKGERYSDLWNGPTTFSPESDFVAFDFQRLIENRNDVTGNAQMLLILKWLDEEIIKNRERNIRLGIHDKIAVAIDEAHLFIDEKFPVALDFMYQLAKRIRKYDGMFIMITQNVKDFMGTPEIAKKSQGIINVSQYSMIFSLAPNDMNDLSELYRSSGGLNESERQAIVHSPRGSAFFISSASRRTRVSIWATPETVAMFSEAKAPGQP